MIVAYIAGPFRAPTAWGIAENIRAAERVGLLVARAGAMPLIPHANTANFHGEGEDQFWLDGTLELMRRCDVVVCTPEWQRSSGARAEVAEAKLLGLPVFYLADPDDDGATLAAWLKDHAAQWSRYCGERTRMIAPIMRSGKKAHLNVQANDAATCCTITVEHPRHAAADSTAAPE